MAVTAPVECDLVVEDGRRLICGTLTVPCVIGRGGLIAAADKREGDGATPIGTWPVREVFYRADRVVALPDLGLPARALGPDDGWSDAPDDPSYNRPVRHPHGTSAERLWREDGLYDVIVVLGYNDDPPVPGAGSAIFFHLMAPEATPTEGCVAITRDAMLAILPHLSRASRMVIKPPT